MKLLRVRIRRGMLLCAHHWYELGKSDLELIGRSVANLSCVFEYVSRCYSNVLPSSKVKFNLSLRVGKGKLPQG